MLHLDGSTANVKQILDVNVLGLTIMTRETVKLMRKNKTDGHINHISIGKKLTSMSLSRETFGI
jgi:NAD(P)-dependent dehydrogenase (short-subunit alcohol dehydrogenase family)